MAEVSDMRLLDRVWYHRYKFRKIDPLPWVPHGPSPQESRVAVVTSAGVHLPQDTPFEKMKGGDFSYRWIPEEAPVQELVCTHPSGAWDRSGVEADPNMAMPLDRLKELRDQGVIGSLAPRHASFQGSITAPLRLMRNSAPEMARAMADDGVDLAILTPV